MMNRFFYIVSSTGARVFGWAALGLITIGMFSGCEKKTPPSPPPEVQVMTVAPTNMPIFEEWIGSLDGSVNAQIRAQVTGYLLKQNYREGSEVKKGDALFEIEPRPFQAALDQAKARQAQSAALAVKTGQDVKRYVPLAKEQAISQQELDNAMQADLAAQAQIKSDQAAAETAELNLSFTKVVSPIDGIAGIATAQIGDLVSQSSGLLTTVSTLDPIKVYFSVSEQSYMDFWRRFVSGTNETDLEMQLVLSDGKIYPHKGKFYLADRQVNQNTGTLQIAGIFPNPDLLLRPGQYGRVRVQTQTRTNALAVPQRAVTELQGSYQVVIVEQQNTNAVTHMKPVKVGPRVNNNWIIEEGLKPDDKVVVEGLQQVKEGSNAIVKPFPQPMPSTNAPAASTNNSAKP